MATWAIGDLQAMSGTVQPPERDGETAVLTGTAPVSAMKEYPVEKMMRDAKILQIYEGTNQIQRDIIGLALNKEYAAAARK